MSTVVTVAASSQSPQARCTTSALCDEPIAPSKKVSGGLGNDFYFSQGTAEAIVLSGTCAAIRHAGVPMPQVFPGPRSYEQREQVIGEDGHAWYVWGEDAFAMRASRPRTDSERERYIDLQNSRVFSSYFTSDRLLMCQRIAFELLCMAESARPDVILPRSIRRANRRKLEVLARVQLQLTSFRKCNMPEIRATLASVGVVFKLSEL